MMVCLSENDLILDEWGKKLLQPLNGGRYPIGGMIELNERCNLSCVHCFINQSAGSRLAKSKELSTAQIKAILDEISDAGCLFLTLTGGEPLLRQDFSEIYQYAKKRGMLITLFTNGTMLTPEIADGLASSPPQMVEITMYGATRETYESVTRVKGSYDRFVNGLHLLLERNIKVGLKAVILSVNKHELEAMQAFSEDLGLNFRYDGTIWPRLNGDQNAYPYRLSVEEMISLDRENPERYEKWEERRDAYKGVKVRNEYVFSCGAGLRTFHIDSSGQLSACIMVRKPSFDLNVVPFSEAWESLGEIRHWKRQKHTICENCTVGGLCSQCPGWSLIVHGDYETPVDYICQLGLARARQMAEVKL
jgi:radical SAM protein with 4Fe4S-binding SPASM domain